MADLRAQPERGPESPEPKKGGRKGKTPLRKALTSLLVILAGLVVYAYGFEVVKINLGDIGSPQRRTSLTRIVRALGHPDLVTYETTQVSHDVAFWVPCPEGGVAPPAEPATGPVITADPSCADPRATVTVSGRGLPPGAAGRVSFVATSGVALQPVQIKVGSDGTFSVPYLLPNRPDGAAQTIRVDLPEQVGSWFHRVAVQTTDIKGNPVTVLSPRLSKTATDTWAKIIETVFLALIATTFGTALAVPLSFVAARNLMRDIAVPPINLGMILIAGPIGMGLGGVAAVLAQHGAGVVAGRPGFGLGLVGVLAVLVWFLLRRSLFVEDVEVSPLARAGRILVMVVAFVAAIAALYVAAGLGVTAGDQLSISLGRLGFLGAFLSSLSQIVSVGLVVVAAVAGAGALARLAGKMAYGLRKRLPAASVRIISIPLLAVAGALTATIISAGLNWMYDLGTMTQWVVLPAVGALLGLALGVRSYRREAVKIGLSVYYVARTVYNTLRAIEPLVMAIVFVVWVGIGPFAGSLALTLHTIAGLAKLYSEQVESIQPGPLEAIRATGATRMQTVIYGVVPQIVPPYISFTMYRWDINVRMSTIIGFVGGGGIGFLLQQNITLLNYRGAAAQMLAIAIVVATMDYLSSRIRERFV